MGMDMGLLFLFKKNHYVKFGKNIFTHINFSPSDCTYNNGVYLSYAVTFDIYISIAKLSMIIY